LGFASVIGELDMTLLRCGAFLDAIVLDPGGKEDVPDPGALPDTVHHSPVEPIDTQNLFNSSPHRVPAITGALKSTGYPGLREVVDELFHAQT
jgi:hypothetical protein